MKKVKTYLNLGAAWRDESGNLRAEFELIGPDGKAVATAGCECGIVRRFIKSSVLPDRQAHEFKALAGSLYSDKTVKSLEWSYPTSPNADAYGFPAGCWSAELAPMGEHGPQVGHAVRAFAESEKAQALEYLRALPFAWSPVTLHIHPEYAAARQVPAAG